MLLFILSLIDILAGIFLIFPNLIGFYIGILVLLKGLSSMLAIPTGNIGIVIMGGIDLVAGLILIFNFGIPWFWLLPMLKGFYSLIIGLGNM